MSSSKVGKVRDIAAVVLTFNRHPQPNYLRATLENLHRGGALTSKRLHSLKVVSPHKVFASSEVGSSKLAGFASYVKGGHPANLNTAIALETGLEAGTEWVLFLEDDIDVIGDFFDSAGAWLDEVSTEKVDIYPLGANYPEVNPRGNPLSAFNSNSSEVFWKYPTHKFYGTQAVVFRAKDLLSLVEYIKEDTYKPIEQILSDGTRQIAKGSGYDIMMARWHRTNKVPWLLTPVPSFVQHIGETSFLTPKNTPHRFPSWPGRDWSFLESKEVAHA